MPTLVPFLEDLNSRFTRQFEQIIADAGYESEENYAYLKKMGQKAFIKPAHYEQAKTRKYKSQMGQRENMTYDEEIDTYTCANEKLLKPIETKIRKSKSGYEREVTIYEGEDCNDCPLRAKCTRAKLGNNKRLEVSKKMIKYRAESETTIKSEEGIILRKNRSIQVEGAFGVLKQDYGFRKFLSRGKLMILIELLLLCMGYNIQKLHNKIQGKRLGHQLHSEYVV